MANYNCYSRSSYFKVKNEEKYKEFCSKWKVELICKESEGETLYGFLSHDLGIPIYYEKNGEWVLDDEGFLEELADLLDPEWVAIFQEIGYEKMRYLVGDSLMIDSQGNITTVSINDIYDKAKKKFTRCEY